ncbi:MAG: hypothetical protein ACE5FT_04950 [Candidatus Nanoarchaeia archaeon]
MVELNGDADVARYIRSLSSDDGLSDRHVPDLGDVVKYLMRTNGAGIQTRSNLLNVVRGLVAKNEEGANQIGEARIEELESLIASFVAERDFWMEALAPEVVVPVFDTENLVYGNNSDYGGILHAVNHANGLIEGQPSLLVSAAEEAHYRTTQDPNVQLRGQWSRTPAIYFKQEGKWYVAFDDSADPAENIVLARAEELRNAHRDNDGVCVLPQSDGHISIMLNRARRAGRVVPVLEDSPQSVQTDAFGDHEIMKAIFHEDVARNYGNWLRQRGRQSVNLYTSESSYLDGLGIPDDSVDVRGVGLVGGVVGAVIRFNFDDGCARSVARAQRA